MLDGLGHLIELMLLVQVYVWRSLYELGLSLLGLLIHALEKLLE